MSKNQSSVRETAAYPEAGFSPYLQQLLDDLSTYAKEYPSFDGMIDKDDVYRLRYHSSEEVYIRGPSVPPELKTMLEGFRRSERKAVCKLESIAKRIASQLAKCGVELPPGESIGASVMAWAIDVGIKDTTWWPAFGACSFSDPFTTIRDKLLETLEQNAEQLSQASETASGRGYTTTSRLRERKRKSVAELKVERGEWMLDNCDPSKLTNLELQAKVNAEAPPHGWQIFESETGNGAFDAYKTAYRKRYKEPFQRDDRGKAK